MGVNFIPAKKSSNMGKMGKAAKKANTPPMAPAPLPSCIRRTKNHRTASVATKKSRLQGDPKSWAKTLPQRKKERIIGRREKSGMARVVGGRGGEGAPL